MAIALCLIALALGYRVLLSANTEKDGLKLLGQVIGISVMIVAVLAMTMSFCPKYGKYLGSKCSKCVAGSGYAKPVCPLGQNQQ